MKPILFNTDMVVAIMEGRKTVTRRLVKPQPGFFYDVGGRIPDPDNPDHIAFLAMDPNDHEEIRVPPYQPGDILYVRETWRVNSASNPPSRCTIGYKAGGDATFDEIIALPTAKGEWKPSIHMPKEAARIFLRVKDVRVERLNNMQEEDAIAEGFPDLGVDADSPLERFSVLWDKTISRELRDEFGWYANPWVWEIEFEKISKEEAMTC